MTHDVTKNRQPGEQIVANGAACQPFHIWRHHSRRAGHHVVYPDGCRDLLIRQRSDGPTEVSLTDIDLQPRVTRSLPGVEMTGYRLQPGAILADDVVKAIAADHRQAGAILTEARRRPDELEEVIAALAARGATTAAVAGAAGVSPRTLQRRFQAGGLPPPDFWRVLARARRAVVMLAGSDPLADVAVACGFSDQAHMTRELTRWFGATPTRLRNNRVLLDLLAQPALGTWTGEQISTR